MPQRTAAAALPRTPTPTYSSRRTPRHFSASLAVPVAAPVQTAPMGRAGPRQRGVVACTLTALAAAWQELTFPLCPCALFACAGRQKAVEAAAMAAHHHHQRPLQPCPRFCSLVRCRPGMLTPLQILPAPIAPPLPTRGGSCWRRGWRVCAAGMLARLRSASPVAPLPLRIRWQAQAQAQQLSFPLSWTFRLPPCGPL